MQKTVSELSETLKRMTTSSSTDFSTLKSPNILTIAAPLPNGSVSVELIPGHDTFGDEEVAGKNGSEARKEAMVSETVSGEQRRSHYGYLSPVSNDAILRTIASVRPRPTVHFQIFFLYASAPWNF